MDNDGQWWPMMDSDGQIDSPTPQPPFSPSVDSLCHLWITTTHSSYRFPILKLPPPPSAVLLGYVTLCEDSSVACEETRHGSEHCIETVVASLTGDARALATVEGENMKQQQSTDSRFGWMSFPFFPAWLAQQCHRENMMHQWASRFLLICFRICMIGIQ